MAISSSFASVSYILVIAFQLAQILTVQACFFLPHCFGLGGRSWHPQLPACALPRSHATRTPAFYREQNPDKIVRGLQRKCAPYLGPLVVSTEQLKRLVVRLIEQVDKDVQLCSEARDDSTKENTSVGNQEYTSKTMVAEPVVEDEGRLEEKPEDVDSKLSKTHEQPMGEVEDQISDKEQDTTSQDTPISEVGGSTSVASNTQPLTTSLSEGDSNKLEGQGNVNADVVASATSGNTVNDAKPTSSVNDEEAFDELLGDILGSDYSDDEDLEDDTYGTAGDIDLNKVSEGELDRAKKNMNNDFLKNRIRPGDEGYEFDKRVEFEAPEDGSDCSWDEDSDEDA